MYASGVMIVSEWTCDVAHNETIGRVGMDRRKVHATCGDLPGDGQAIDRISREKISKKDSRLAWQDNSPLPVIERHFEGRDGASAQGRGMDAQCIASPRRKLGVIGGEPVQHAGVEQDHDYLLVSGQSSLSRGAVGSA